MIKTRVALSPEPVVTLENALHRPYDNAVATARTCYSSKVITADDVSADAPARLRRGAHAQSPYKGGHHNPIPPATFQFVLDKVSRRVLLSSLRSPPL